MPMASPPAVRQDWLELQHRVLKYWQRRWVVLREDRLVIFKPSKENAAQPGELGLELLLSAVTGVEGPDGDDHILKLLNGMWMASACACACACACVRVRVLCVVAMMMSTGSRVWQGHPPRFASSVIPQRGHGPGGRTLVRVNCTDRRG